MPLSFTSSGDYPIGDDPVALAVADLNGDGTPDIVTVNRHDGTISILQGNGDGTFMGAATLPVGSFPASIAVADLNGDGAADLAIADKDDGTVSVLLGRGDGSFASKTEFATGDSLPLSVTIGDLNGDGKLDLVTGSATAGDTSVSVLLGNGDGSFQPQVGYSVPGSSNAVALADLNGDGKSDLVAVSPSFASVLLGNGDGTFQTPNVVGYGGYSVAIADLDGDGISDLVYTQSRRVLVQLGNGDGTFQPPSLYDDDPGAFRVAVADLDGDGRPDLALSGDTSVQVLLGNGDGTFQSAQRFYVNLPHAVAIADLNNDGKPDIASVNTTGTMSILFNTTNAPPVAHDDSYSFAEDTTLTVAAPAILANDSDADGDTLSVAALVSGPAHGSLALNPNGALTYTPVANFNGTDSFTYKVNDGQTDSNVATVTLTVTPVNDAPVAHDDSYTLTHDTPLTVAAAGVLSNDSDLEGNPLSALLVNGPAHGSLALNANGALTYTPAANFSGTDSFTYKANDGQTDSNVATVNLTITSANHAPVANDDIAGVAKGQTITADVQHGVLANDTDPDGNSLSVSAVNGSAANVGRAVVGTYGSLTVNGDGSYGYVASKLPLPSQAVAQDHFSYTANDGHGGTSTAALTVTITSPGTDYRAGTDGNDTLIAGSGQSVLDGGNGNDVLKGGNGADVLIGGHGADIMTGGNGPDRFVFGPNFGNDVITDFKPHNDVIQFDHSLFASFADLHAADDGHGNTVITYDVTDTVTLQGVAHASLHASDFLFL